MDQEAPWRRLRAAPGCTDILWTCIPVLLVLFLAPRSWVTVLDLYRPAVAATAVPTGPVAVPR